MADIEVPLSARVRRPGGGLLAMLFRDPVALVAACYLVLVVLVAIVVAPTLVEFAGEIDFAKRNLPPFSFENGWLFVLGSDGLGRSLLARVIVASQNTLSIAVAAVAAGVVIGTLLGLWAGFRGGLVSAVIMRLTDALMSFPAILLSILLLYILQARVGTVVVVLAVSRIPLFLRVTRAEVLEIRERVFVTASRALGARPRWIVWKHVLPAVVPTLLTLSALEIAFVMLAESGLSFIGIGVQTPEISWGLMVAQGRNYLSTTWWLAFWPGFAIVLTAMSLNLVSNFLRTALDPLQRWRLDGRKKSK